MISLSITTKSVVVSVHAHGVGTFFVQLLRATASKGKYGRYLLQIAAPELLFQLVTKSASICFQWNW